jgi:ABC-type sugar transport system permease subunit
MYKQEDASMQTILRTVSPARLNLSQRKARLGLLFVSPWLIGFALFKFLPILASLVISFTDFYALEPQATRFVGLDNYARVLQDFNVGVTLAGTLGLALYVLPIQMIAALGFAALLNSKRLARRGLLRAIFFIPSIVPAISVLVVVFGFLDPATGWLNQLILEPLGLAPFPGFFSEAGFNFLLTLVALWTIGPSFLIMLGAMHGVPQELYEAARVDGAGPIYRFFKITLPMISPAILFALIINLVTIFGGVALLDQGATSFSGGASAYDAYIGQVMFGDFDYGYAASLAWVFLLIALAVVIALFRSAQRWVHYADAEGGHVL